MIYLNEIRVLGNLGSLLKPNVCVCNVQAQFGGSIRTGMSLSFENGWPIQTSGRK